MKMKAMHSEKFYYDHWDEFLKEVDGEHYRNLEAELDKALEPLKGIVDERYMKDVAKMYAKQIADSCTQLCLKDMRTIKDVEAGRSSFGFTNTSQKVIYTYEFKKRFEFNCLQLRDFRNKYGI